MKKTILALSLVSAFAAFGSPSVGYMTATNIAARVASNVVTKAYVEDLGVEAGLPNDFAETFVASATTTNINGCTFTIYSRTNWFYAVECKIGDRRCQSFFATGRMSDPVGDEGARHYTYIMPSATDFRYLEFGWKLWAQDSSVRLGVYVYDHSTSSYIVGNSSSYATIYAYTHQPYSIYLCTQQSIEEYDFERTKTLLTADNVGAISTNKLNTGMTMNGTLTIGSTGMLQLNDTAKTWFVNPDYVKVGSASSYAIASTLKSWIQNSAGVLPYSSKVTDFNYLGYRYNLYPSNYGLQANSFVANKFFATSWANYHIYSYNDIVYSVETLPGYLSKNYVPLTRTINGQSLSNDIQIQTMDYPAITNTVNAVKAEFYDEPLSVNWTVKMVNGEMKLYATTNVNMSVLPRYTNWSTDNLPSGVTWAAQPTYDESIDLWEWAYDSGTAQSEEGGANATTLTFGYGEGFTTTRSVIQ